MKAITSSVNVYHIANMVEGGKTPILSNQELKDIGFKMVIYANAPLKAAVKGTKELLLHLHGNGTTAGCEHLMISMKERNDITGLAAMEELEQKYTL